MEKIGILGGTFDPFHLGHLSVLEAAVEEAECDRIMLLPAKMSPFKLEQKIADEKHRIAMVSCVATEYENVEVSTLEIDGPKVSYTYETMKKIQEKRPEDELYFIMGSDSLLTLESWYMGEELLRDFSFILAPRPGYDSTKMKEKKKPSLVLGILSIVLGLLSPIVGLVLGIIGLVLANVYQRESGLDYKTERILNIVGIVVSVLNWIVAIALIFR